jgi:hypothetical protein
MSSDIDADAGYNVLSMSKNTTYFGLLLVAVAMIAGDLVYESCWVPCSNSVPGLRYFL